jgi:hypothetical protein
MLFKFRRGYISLFQAVRLVQVTSGCHVSSCYDRLGQVMSG